MWTIRRINSIYESAKNAKGILIAAGATAYTEFERKLSKKGDEIFVYVYNAHCT